MRLIDADALIAMNNKEAEWAQDIATVSWAYARACFSKDVEDMPTIEAEPVRHGHWIHTGVTNIFGVHQHKCSVCGYSLMVSKACDNENYCCSCGAKMDEVEK